MDSSNSRGATLSCVMLLNNRGIDLFTTGQDAAGAILCFQDALRTIEQHIFTRATLNQEHDEPSEIRIRSNHEKESESPVMTEHDAINKTDTSSSQSVDTERSNREQVTSGTFDDLSPSHRHDTRSQSATSLSSRLQEAKLYISARFVRLAPSASASQGDARAALHKSCLAALTTSFNLALTYQMMSYLSTVEKSTMHRRSALRFYEIAVSIRQRIGDRFGDGIRPFLTVIETSMLNNVAVLYYELGDNTRCRFYFKILHSKLLRFQQLGYSKQRQEPLLSFLGNLVLMLGSEEEWDCSPAAAA